MELTIANPKNDPAIKADVISVVTRKGTLPNCRDELIVALETLIAEHGDRPFSVREVYGQMHGLGTSYAELTVYKAMQRMKLPYFSPLENAIRRRILI